MRRPLPLLLALLPSPALAAPLATGGAPAIPWLRLAFSLAFCVALAWGMAAVLRRRKSGADASPGARSLRWFQPWAPASRSRRIRILETRRASQHGDLCLVELDGKSYFLALTPSGPLVLDRAKAGPPLPEGEQP